MQQQIENEEQRFYIEGVENGNNRDKQAEFSKIVWKTLSAIDASKHTEKKMNLTYLSWAWAWGILMDNFPCSQFEFKPPVSYEDGSAEIWVTITLSDGISQLERSMWLPVMNHKNQAIKQPDSRAISDTRMRCLTKCLAMFGLGHYIYAGEDLPEAEKNPVIDSKQLQAIEMELANVSEDVKSRMLASLSIAKVEDMPKTKYSQMIKGIRAAAKKEMESVK